MCDPFHVQVINLNRSKDRWQAIKKWKHGFSDFNRFNAIDAFNIPINISLRFISLRTKIYIMNKIKRICSDIDDISAIACTLSHRQILQNFYDDESKGEYLITFEDDLNIKSLKGCTTSYYQQVISEMKKLPFDDWDIWLLGMHEGIMGINMFNDCISWQERVSPLIKGSSKLKIPFSFNMYKSYNEYVEVRQFLGAHAIIYKRSAIPKILKHFFPINEHYDSYLSFLAQVGEIRIIYKPSFSITQNNNFISTIKHGIFNISLLNQTDWWYKIFVWLIIFLFLLLIIYIIYYL